MRRMLYPAVVFMICWAGCSKSDAPAQSSSDGKSESSSPPSVVANIQPADIKPGNSIVECLAFSPDGSILVTGTSRSVQAWDTTTGKLKFDLKGMPSYTLSLAFSKNGRYVACGGVEGTVKLFDSATGNEVRGWKTEGKVQALIFADNDATLVCSEWAAPHMMTFAWRLADGSELFKTTYRGHPVPDAGENYSDETVGMAISADGKWLASATVSQRDLNIRVWDIRTGQQRDQLGIANPVLSLSWSKDGILAAGDGLGKLRLWDQSGRSMGTLQDPEHDDPLHAIAFSPDGKLLAAGAQRFVDIWEMTSQKRINSVEQMMGSIRAIAFSPDARFVAFSDNLNNARIRPIGQADIARADTPAEAQTSLWALSGHERTITALVFSPDGKLLASAGEDRTIKLWDPQSRRLVLTLEGHPGTPVSIEFSPDGKRLLSSATDQMVGGGGGIEKAHSIRMWDVGSGKVLGHVETLQHTFPPARFVPNGRHFIAADAKGIVRMFDSATLKPAGTFEVNLRGEKLRSLAISPDGKQVAMGYGLQPSPTRVLICDAGTGREIAVANTNGPPTSIVYSRDGKRIGVVEGMAGIYDSITGNRVRTLEHRYYAAGVAFSPDGKFIATCGHDGSIKWWDADTWQTKAEISPEGRRDFGAMALSPDGRIVAAASGNEIVLWRHP